MGLSDKVSRRQGGKLLWSSYVQRQFGDNRRMMAKVWMYPAEEGECTEAMGVLSLLPKGDQGAKEDQGEYLVHLNGIRFERGEYNENQVKLQNFTIVQHILNDKVYNETWTSLVMKPLLIDKFIDPNNRGTTWCRDMSSGGVEAL